MSFFSSLFNSSITPVQYCFPYFFDEKQFKQQIEEFGLLYRLTIDEKNKVFNPLLVFNLSDFSLQINYFTYLMFDLYGNLIVWNTEEDLISISKINFTDGVVNKFDFTIKLKDFAIGKSQLDTDYTLSNFVSYVRKSDIKYELDYYENFAIVIIDGVNINIMPFDWFNKTGGDYGYVWPATAQLDLRSFELKGKGMRMSDFKIQLHNLF